MDIQNLFLEVALTLALVYGSRMQLLVTPLALEGHWQVSEPIVLTLCQ